MKESRTFVSISSLMLFNITDMQHLEFNFRNQQVSGTKIGLGWGFGLGFKIALMPFLLIIGLRDFQAPILGDFLVFGAP